MPTQGRIVSNPDVGVGKPTIQGVRLVLGMIRSDHDIDRVLADDTA